MKFLLVILSLLAVAAPQEERKALREFNKAFKVGRSGPAPVFERINAIAVLQDFDSEKVADALVDAFTKVEDEVQGVDSERFENNQKIAKVIEQTGGATRIPQPLYLELTSLRQANAQLRRKLDSLRELQFELRGRLIKLESNDAHKFLVKKVLSDKKASVFLKLTISEMAERFDGSLVEDIEKTLRRSKRTTEIVPLLDALAESESIGKKLGDRVLGLLDHKEEAVRERAAVCLAKLGWRSAVLPMIDRLEKEEGLTKKRFGAALADLTGQKLGTMVASWRGWWEKEGEAFMRDGRPEPEEPIGVRPGRGGKGAGAQGQNDEYGYFGIPQDGKAIVYVIDSSGSMSAKIDRKKTGTVTKGEDAQMNRLEGCKIELIGAIQRLSDGKMFNVIHYSDVPLQWQPKLVKSSAQTKKDAVAWVRQLQPKGSTNIHDAMQMAFGLAGRGARDQYYESEVDMVFLLSDGSPTKPDGKPDDPETVLAAIRVWNAMKRVTIHTIAIGGNLNFKFMQQLAAENGGEFRRAMK
jgi:hypothetical protein